MTKTAIKITSKKLNLQECCHFVTDNSCGAIATFIGVVRNNTDEKEVVKLEFTAYTSMAIKEMQKIADTALNKFDIEKIAIYHAEGVLVVGEIPVIIAVSAKHRKAAFKACQFAIDTLKETVPIWKKEYFTNGEVWVNAHP